MSAVLGEMPCLFLLQAKEALEEAERKHEEQLQDNEQRLEQSTADLRDALEEAHSSAETSANAIEQWRRRSSLKLTNLRSSFPPRPSQDKQSLGIHFTAYKLLLAMDLFV